MQDVLGASPAIEALRANIGRLMGRARGSSRLPPVLIQGETGTGKGLVAGVLHRTSPRAGGPFVAVNCAAIPEGLLEAELFGFERGAFTDAKHAKAGLFQTAHRGVLFLDEVGLLPAALKAKLLNAIEEGSVRRLGSTRSERIDVWIISASNVDLRAAILERRFREDLYQRLAGLTLTLPPLRERGDDVIMLAEYYLARASADFSLPPRTLTTEARARLLAYRWPGNVRELANLMERAALLSDTAQVTAAALDLKEAPLTAPPVPPPGPGAGAASLDEAMRDHLQAVLDQTGGNITHTAAILGIARNTLRSRIRKLWLKGFGAVAPYPGPPDLAASAPASVRDAQEKTGGAAPTQEVEGREPGLSLEGITTPLPNLPQMVLGSNADIHWERRWITLLRVSLAVESDDDVRDSTSALEIAADKVQTFGGRVIELGRTALEAAFGLDPLEDAAQRAAYAALSIQRAGARARERSSSTLVSRIAVHADSYLIGRMGASIQIDQEAKQAASAFLATLIAAAPPDSAVVSRMVLPFLRRRFEFDRPVAAGVAGEAHPLLGRADRPAMFDKQISLFVGRESEIGLLENRWGLAAQGLGPIVGIVGDPGVGKSRLIWEFLRGGTSRGLVLETASVTLGRPTPYLAIIEMLRTCFGVEAGETDLAIRNKVAQHLADLDPSLAVSLPAFLSLLDV